ncbi:hypothetical protein LO772_08455 [Yinghuangia sp. ASG 101]|uniref:hypothetical protein n=1 Tax=Yinghuangia sp. ASG 101 TaxID=2896848 RepID=UPI001E57F22E|nr:hypothetical protein [Yinghuangia sp. ASG 101]UGQ13618.1 hypothetical protein LO772_08455 [Yinghuangia sp. ASG 101]
MIQINIQSRHQAGPDDELGREYCGWAAGMTDQETYQAARGCWSLGQQADGEKFAVVVHDKLVRCVIEIDHIDTMPNGKRALIGRPVAPGHPYYDRWYGMPAPSNRGGGSITYVDDTTKPT